MDVARSAPQGAHYHADAIYLLPKMGIKKGASAFWYSESAWLLYLTNDKVPSPARDCSEVARTVCRCCFPHTGNGVISWYLSSSSLYLSVGFSLLDEAMDVARPAPRGANCHAGVIY